MSIDPGKTIITTCQLIRAGMTGRKLIKDIDKMFDNPELLRGGSIVTRTGILTVSIVEIIGTLTGKLQPKDGTILKTCELLLRMFDLPIRFAQSFDTISQDPTLPNTVRTLEKKVIYPLIGLVRTTAEAAIYQEKHYLEIAEKDPNAKRPIYEHGPHGPYIIGEETIDPVQCKQRVAEGEKWQLATSVIEVATGLGLGSGFYDQLAKRQVMDYILPLVLQRPMPQRPAPMPRQRPIAVNVQVPAAPPDDSAANNIADKIKDSLKENLPQILAKDIVFGKYICPITLQPIGKIAAEITNNGRTKIYYEASAIHYWLGRNQHSPVTRLPLSLGQLQYPAAEQQEIDAAVVYHMSELGPRIDRLIENYFKNQPDRDVLLGKASAPKAITSYSPGQIIRILESMKAEILARLTLHLSGEWSLRDLTEIINALKNTQINQLVLHAQESQAAQAEIDQIKASEPKLQLVLQKADAPPAPAQPSTVDNGPVGFKNIRRSCFLNAALQLIFNSTHLREAIEIHKGAKDPVLKSLYELMHIKSYAEGDQQLMALRQELYGDDAEDQDAGECLHELTNRLNWLPIRIATTNNNGTIVHDDSVIAVNTHDAKNLSEALDRYFRPHNSSHESQKIISDPEIVFVQLIKSNSHQSNEHLSYPKNHFVYLPCNGHDVKYRITGFISHANNHFTADVRNFRDPEGSKRWIHCDDIHIIEIAPNAEPNAMFLALEKCNS